MKRFLKKALSLTLSGAMLLGMGLNALPVDAAGIDVGANPTPKVDIAVNVPSDYPGTFLEFKQELTEKLIEQGMSASDFRITTTAVSIDTTDTNGWYVYDHYRDTAAYNALNLSDDQKAKQPFRQADNTHTNGTGTIESYFKNNTNTTGNACKNFDKHIYSYVDDEGKASMVFAGYGTQALTDYMIYPAASNSRRNFSFDINPAVIDTHTIGSYGFFLNAGINGGNVQGYALVFAAGTNACSLQKINSGVNAAMTGSVVKNLPTMNFGPKNTVRLTVELNKNSVTVQYQAYDANGNLGAIADLLRDEPLADTGFNGFGPLVNYTGHGCASLSIMKYVDLEMSYEASAFDALKNVQYYEGANQKYFINLTGDKNDPQIPEEFTKDGKPNESYHDGINRMNENKIFYISNTDDGKIVTDSEKDDDNNLTHQGLGSANGFYASGDNYVDLIAQYIYTNHRDGVKFQQAEVESELPLANFYIKDADSESDEQIMTIHLQHLVKAAEYNQTAETKVPETVAINIFDKSRIGTKSGADGKLTEWTLTVTDPDNTVVNTQTVDDPAKLQNYVFDKNSKSGRYTLTLVVKDDKGNESKDFSTYVIAFLDDKHPYIEGANTGKNIATITLTDTGDGIDEDGITFIEDDRGSGVAAYWITNDLDATPTEDDWEKLPFAQHIYEFEYEIESTEPLVVWTRDECGNVGNKAVFQPTHVRVEDPDGNPIDEYYVIGDKPIIVLPPDEDVPDPEDPDNEHFSGWTTPGGDPVTPGTTPEPEDNVIVIRPNYSRDYAKMVYLANGGSIRTAQGEKPVAEYAQVISGASIYTKIEDHNVVPYREGYSFTGWKLLNTDSADKAGDSAYINNAANVADISEQRAIKEVNAEGITTRDTYYLVAQWKEGEYTLRLDPNGGSAGNVRSIENVKFQTNVGSLNIPVSGRGIPTKPGYIFQGWSEANDNDPAKIFKFAQGVSGTAVAAPIMPSSDKTIYAVWKEDTNKFVVSFDSNGGSRISDQAYLTATATKYDAFLKPSRTGYTFDGWFEKQEDAEGNVIFGSTEYVGGETFIKKAAHSFIAKWTANENTKYTVDYYINSGNKDSNGNYIYTKTSADLSKTYVGKTESAAAVQEADKLAELTVDGVTYWYNAANENNQLSGIITGSPALSLKLYYDRYFDVTATHKGEGTVTGASKVKEGEMPTVTWAAAEGSYVTKVVVDGAIRDDLLNETSYTYPAGLHENHKIYVEFTSEEEEPQKPVNPNPPEMPVDKYYDIRTSVVGCTDPSKYEITPTTSVKGGEDHTVAWSIKDSNYQIVKIEVDGVAQEITNNSSVDFSGVATNHTVVITVSAVPTIGGNTTEGHYTVTVNRYGGDDKVEISNTMVVNKGDKAPVSWDTTNSEYKIYKIMIDGEEITLSEQQMQHHAGYVKKPLNNVQANHVVDIYMAKPDEEGKIDPPDLTEEKYVQLTTQLIGAPGSITGGAVIEQGSDYKIDWDVVTGTDTDRDSDTYVYYGIEKIVVNDEVKTDENGVPVTEISELEMKDISEDTDVKVYVKPVMHRVTILKYGEGTVSPSKSVYHLANYKDIEATPETGWSTVKIVVDNVTTYELELPEPAPTPEPDPEPVTRQNAPQAPVAEEAADESAVVENSASEESSAAESAEPAGEESSEESEESSVAEETPVVEDQQADESSELRTASRMARALGIVRRDAEDAGITPRAADPSIDDLDGIVVDHVIEVYFTKNDEEGNPTPLPDDVKLNKVNVTIEGGAGTVTNGPAIVEDNGETSISWTIGDPEHYEVEKITVNGVEQPTTDPLTIENITEDQNVVITLKKKPVPNNEVVTPPTLRETLHTVSAVIKGDGGSIVGGGQVADGGSREVSWTKGDDSEVKYVFVNGELRDDLKEASSVLLENIGADQTVVVVIGKPGVPPVNVDKDDDGKPDINIDKDDDGEPDVNIDKDGDGEPDINIDTDDDGEPDINIDTDDDGEPDINIDTDGDGEPDINIDTDDDGEPDINIDTDDDGEPDINIDKDGDGKPDINIDKDKDGKPDVNIDKDGDGEPDINIDTDGDGEPDINIDTDGDGEPEVNIDHDGDGKPDINIDTDGDGKPDINIDTNGDGKPDINIDTNGDGKADINIDINGDGIPDLNIDTDGDGKPDKNIDADGDGKIDNVGPATGDEGMRPMMAVLLGAVLAMAVLLLIKRRFARS